MAEIDNQMTPPRLSDEAIAHYRSLLTPALERDHPAHYARLKQSVDEALGVTGQTLAPPADGRSPAQALHDRRFGIEPGKLPAVLGALVERDVADKIDSTAVARQLEQLGYKHTVEAAKDVLRQTGSTVKPEQLGVHALRQLEIYGAHLKRHAASRPKYGEITNDT
jgi:hypothetical protein